MLNGIEHPYMESTTGAGLHPSGRQTSFETIPQPTEKHPISFRQTLSDPVAGTGYAEVSLERMQHSEQTHALTREIVHFLKRHGKPRATQGPHPRQSQDTYLQDIENALHQGLPELKSRVIWAVGRLARNPQNATLKGLVRAFHQSCQHDEALWLQFPVNLNHLPADVQQSLRTHLEQQEDQVHALAQVVHLGLLALGHPIEGKP